MKGEREGEGMTEGKVGMQDVRYSRDSDRGDAWRVVGTGASLPVGRG